LRAWVGMPSRRNQDVDLASGESNVNMGRVCVPCVLTGPCPNGVEGIRGTLSPVPESRSRESSRSRTCMHRRVVHQELLVLVLHVEELGVPRSDFFTIQSRISLVSGPSDNLGRSTSDSGTPTLPDHIEAVCWLHPGSKAASMVVVHLRRYPCFPRVPVCGAPVIQTVTDTGQRRADDELLSELMRSWLDTTGPADVSGGVGAHGPGRLVRPGLPENAYGKAMAAPMSSWCNRRSPTSARSRAGRPGTAAGRAHHRTHGTQEQIDLYVRDMLTGRKAWCQLFSEPQAVRPRRPADPAIKDGDEWIINGQKV